MTTPPSMLGERAVLLLSGGQDSFVCLHWARKRFQRVEAVSIEYEQRHKTELDAARRIAAHWEIPHSVYSIGSLLAATGASALTASQGSLVEKHQLAPQLPASFVPGRNGLFLTVAANHAFAQGDPRLHLVIGACQTDYSGYPDCRDNFLAAKALELSLGFDRPVTIYRPLMWLRKSEIFKLADDLGCLSELLEMTVSCYEGSRQNNNWGLGCGTCPACVLRARGYSEYCENFSRRD